MSHWLYIHKDLGGEPGVLKPGITMLPYSAVRARQKFIWKKFELDHLYFGRSTHIKFLESKIKKNFYFCSAKAKLRTGGQTELFKIDEEELLLYIQQVISAYELDVKKILLDKPYSANNSGQCPFGCPSEKYAFDWCEDKVNAWFGPYKFSNIDKAKNYYPTYIFNELFTVES